MRELVISMPKLNFNARDEAQDRSKKEIPHLICRPLHSLVRRPYRVFDLKEIQVRLCNDGPITQLHCSSGEVGDACLAPSTDSTSIILMR